MLMNNLDPEVAEIPEQLVRSTADAGRRPGLGRFDAIVRELQNLEPDQTSWCSLKPVGVIQTEDAPRVMIANSNLVPTGPPNHVR